MIMKENEIIEVDSNDDTIGFSACAEGIMNAPEVTLEVPDEVLYGDVEPGLEDTSKTLINTSSSEAKDNVSDIEFWGDGDTFKLICKAHSVREGWMKSTKAMQAGRGCVIQVTTQQGDNVAEALTYVPNVKIREDKDREGNVVNRKIVSY